MKLPASAILVLSVYPHLLSGEERLDLGAAVDQSRKLQQLAEPDHRTANFNVANHPPTVSSKANVTPDIDPTLGFKSVGAVARGPPQRRNSVPIDAVGAVVVLTPVALVVLETAPCIQATLRGGAARRGYEPSPTEWVGTPAIRGRLARLKFGVGPPIGIVAMGMGFVHTMARRGARVGLGTAARPRRAVVALVVSALVVLGLLTVFAVSLANTQARSRQDVEARVHERAVLAGALLDSLLQTVRQQLSLYQARYGTRFVTTETMNRYVQQNAYLALLDRSGRVLASSRGFTSRAQADLRISAALRLVRSGHPYGLGNVLPYGRGGVINLAVPFPTRYGERVLLTGFAPSALAAFLTSELRRIPGVRGAHNYLIDGNDTVLASNNPYKSTGYRFTDPGAAAALDRPSGDRDGHYYEQLGLENSTWKVVLVAPNGPLFASVSGLRKWLPWMIFLAFALVAAAALALGSRVLRSAERELRDANARLAHDALHDPLTGLANRALFMDRLTQSLHRASRDGTAGCAVLYLDTDRFKLVNDSLSHAVGDELLIAMAERLTEAVRPGDTVARLGGDEFTMLLENVTSTDEATAVAGRVHHALKDPFRLGRHELVISASIGIALSSAQTTAADLLRNADIAMYAAKRRSAGGHAIFDATMHSRVVKRLRRETALRQALEHSLVNVHYQPIVDIATGRISELEALARWPGGGHVPPTEFVAIAEESGLIGQLGLHVLRTALNTFAGWRRAGLVSDEVRISVNISQRQLDDPALPEQILDAITDAGLPASAVRLEITESILMRQPDRMRRIISELCARGVGLHLDDFGTGYASLAALLQFPLDGLKIDRSLVAALSDHDGANDAIVRSAIGLAHDLGMYVIAEGIEEPAQLNRLHALRCEYGQGYHFSKALDAQQTTALLTSWTAVGLTATT